MIRSRDYIGFLAPSALLPRRSGSRRVRVFPIASLFLRGLTVPILRVLTLATLSLVLLAGPGAVDVSNAAAPSSTRQKADAESQKSKVQSRLSTLQKSLKANEAKSEETAKAL